LGGNTVHTNRFTYLDNATAAGTTNWLALTDNTANGTEFAYKGNHFLVQQMQLIRFLLKILILF
jgi:hypothetical protein